MRRIGRKNKAEDSSSDSEHDEFGEAGESDEVENQFIRCSILHYLVILFGLSILFWLSLLPDSFPYESLGGPGSRLKYLTDNYITLMRISVPLVILVHVIEALTAHHKCKELSLNKTSHKKWIIQTLLLGYTSIQALNTYESSHKTKQKKSK